MPTTFIIDAQGQPHHINHGLTSKEKLRRQLEATRLDGGEEGIAVPALPQAAGSDPKFDN